MTLRQFLALVGIGVVILLGLYCFEFIEPNKDKVKFIKEVPKITTTDKK